MLRASSADFYLPLSWNVVEDVRQVLSFPFMVNAVRAGTVAAVLAGVVGWFMVARRQSFIGHTVAVVGFPGAAGAVWLGMSATYGFFAFAVIAAALIALASGSGHDGQAPGEDSAVTGTVHAAAVALGFLFTSLYGGFTGSATALLFGSFLGVTAGQVQLLLAVAAVAVLALVVLARPLLFATVDPAVAAARGVPVRAVSVAFLLLLAVAAAEVAQVTGTLLVFALLVVPAATAQALTPRPAASLALTVVIGIVIIWAALFVAFYRPYPIGFVLTTFAFAAYLAAVTWRYRARALTRLRTRLSPAGGGWATGRATDARDAGVPS
ncbi:MAG TPA: iron chelate uptake ABC transporter family permease subunit [Kineosporiaceae bacterium]